MKMSATGAAKVRRFLDGALNLSGTCDRSHPIDRFVADVPYQAGPAARFENAVDFPKRHLGGNPMKRLRAKQRVRPSHL